LPNKQAAWIVLRERVQELADYTRWLAGTRGDEPRLLTAAEALTRIVQTLTPV
jgi:hypothetical protein